MKDKDVYPEPHDEFTLDTGDGHKVWYATTGNPKGKPVVSFHGGPGSKSKPNHLDGFDLDKFLIVQIDQRGCGNSTPLGKTENNTTQDLIEDIEAVRKELEIDRWIVNGGSWGSTLALLYAETHPNRVVALSLISVFLARSEDVEWFASEKGAGKSFPDIIEKRNRFYKDNRVNPKNWRREFLDKLTNGSEEEKKIFAAAAANFELSLMRLDTEFRFINPEDQDEDDIASATIYMHYMANDFFIKDNQIIDKIKAIKSVPTLIIHGRYDLLCTADQAYLLHKALDNSILEFSVYSGHHLNRSGRALRTYMLNTILE